MKKILLGLFFTGLISLAFSQKKEIDLEKKRFRMGKLNSGELKKLALTLKEAGDVETAQRVADAYINNFLFKMKDEQLFTSQNLTFMGEFIGTVKGKVFKLFKKQSAQVNAVLGDYYAERRLMDFIDKKYLPQKSSWKTIRPDWGAIQKKIIRKFGALGEEIVIGERMMYHWDIESLGNNWKDFSEYYVKYFERALKHSIFHVNNMSWAIFEHIDDPETLAFASGVMKYSLENDDQNNVAAYDTYANLLYKTGKTNEAIEWQEKALKMKKGQPDEKLYSEALYKMKMNLPTWKTTGN